MKLQTFLSKGLGRTRDAANNGHLISDIPVVVWIDDELLDVTGIKFVTYHEGGPLFAQIDTEVRRENSDTQDGHESGTRQGTHLG